MIFRPPKFSGPTLSPTASQACGASLFGNVPLSLVRVVRLALGSIGRRVSYSPAAAALARGVLPCSVASKQIRRCQTLLVVQSTLCILVAKLSRRRTRRTVGGFPGRGGETGTSALVY